MEIETIKAKPFFRKIDRSVNTSFSAFDVQGMVENIKLSSFWAKGELYAKVLVKSPEKKVVLTALHKGIEVISFQSDGSISVQIIEGKLKFHTRKESVILDKGQLLTFHDNIKYSLISKEKTVYLLTISNLA